MKTLGHSFLCALLLSSCTTIFNTSTTPVTIHTNEAAKVVVARDTTDAEPLGARLEVERSKEVLKIKVVGDSAMRTIQLYPEISPVYWLNIATGYGFLVDLSNTKRFTYPRHVYVDLQDQETSYLPYRPLSSTTRFTGNLFKLTPLKMVALIHPAFEISYERKLSKELSIELMVSPLLSKYFERYPDYPSHIKGYRMALEGRRYLGKTAPVGPYVALQFDYFKSTYNAVDDFEERFVLNGLAGLGTPYIDYYSVNRKTASISIKYGFQTVRPSGFLFDAYLGFGLKYKNVSHFNREHPEDVIASDQGFSLGINSNREYRGFSVSLPMNFKIGWVF